MLGLVAAGLCLSASAAAQVTVNGQSPVTVNGRAPDKANEQAPDTASDASTVQEDAIYCPTALEPILPGDYYACEARAASGREHYTKMVDMLQEAAYWANKDAQYVLGLAYFNGDTPEVPQNRPLGLAWLALAAERKKPQYQLAYASARSKATPAELRRAVVEWRTLRLKYADRVAAPRAIRHFNHAIQSIDDAARDGGLVYLHGFSPYAQSAFAVANKLHDEADTDFSDIHGSVVVGKPEWVQAQPASASSVK
ncbi:hypothetical protein DWU98_20895 [Dyella monticola]|uniref:Sel1 repeat family protein n=2 Tax=Dyella monticola TaxID=1927958 RepID=A0A370WS50_9GAMM|nr:hypothetical protein DWU98_20895 [Dyella monticola]